VYFGYADIGRYTFLPVAVVVVLAAFVALCVIYLVGASSGGAAAARLYRWTMRLFWVAMALDVAWAVASGQLTAFVRRFGWTPLFELSVLAFLCLGSMGFMASRYVASKVAADETRPREEGI